MKMVDKKYDLVDTEDNIIQTGTKKDARKLKLFTRSVHILLINNRNELMICKRPPSARRYANQITSSAGGHVEKGEDYKTSATRELKEELNITSPLKDLGRFDVISQKEHTIHHLFLGKAKKVSADKNEITSFKFLSPEIIKKDIALHPRKYAKPFHEAFKHYHKSKNPPVFIVDFDHTIFNWYGFKKDFGKYLKNELKISENIYQKAKDIAEEKKLYNFNTHLKEISKLSKTSHAVLLSKTNIFCKKLPQYIFPDAFLFIKRAAKVGEIILLTYGDKINQEFFIKGTKINKYCKKIIVTHTKIEKRYWIKKYIKTKTEQKIIFINDDPKETIQVLKNITSLYQTILIERPDAKYFTIPRHKNYTVVQKLTSINI